ncbi:hypothetical protein [Chromobacterium violaceum]|uniref:hypothetical protein n=1 Tax=Chromobacterium violaceum TaxID=536 RepID=UPI0015F7DC6A|nr:hypothetical protein [Chromobacterium violaceum]MBA8736604.1 hypothetical protein [Chromobacterium violaceum]
MEIAYALLIIYLIAPYVGLFYFESSGERIIYGDANSAIWPYSIYLLIFFAIVLLFNLNNKAKLTVFSIYPEWLARKIIKRCICILIFCIGMMFVYGVGNMLTGETGRGEFRSTLGGLGFFYILFSLFFPASCVAISAQMWVKSRSRKIGLWFALCFFLGFICGFLTGFKFTCFLISTPGLILAAPRLGVTKIFFVLALSIAFMLFSATYFMGLDTLDALNYLIQRGTVVAVSGTVGVWNNFRDGGPDAIYTLLYALGNKAASFLIGEPVDSFNFLKVNLTRYIGYLTYPKPEEALSGAFNLTVTNFGEAVYFFGESFSWVFAIISGLITAFMLRSAKKAICNGSDIKAIVLVNFLALVIFPWLLNSMIGNLFGIPTIIYFTFVILLVNNCTKPLRDWRRSQAIN